MAKEYTFSKSSGQCATCKTDMVCEQEFMATIREAGDEILREDFCMGCWTASPRDQQSDVLGVWHSRVPKQEEKKKLFVDDDLLVNLFSRLEGSEEPAKVNFRFVLALVLMRKKMLVYDRMEKTGDTEVWQMHFKGSEQVHRVVNPNMDEEKITEVSQNLGQILEGEL